MYAQSIKSAYYKCRRSTFIIHRPRRWHPSYCHRVHVYGKPDSATLATCHALRRNTDLVVHGYGRLTAMFHCFAWCVWGGVYGGMEVCKEVGTTRHRHQTASQRSAARHGGLAWPPMMIGALPLKLVISVDQDQRQARSGDGPMQAGDGAVTSCCCSCCCLMASSEHLLSGPPTCVRM